MMSEYIGKDVPVAQMEELFKWYYVLYYFKDETAQQAGVGTIIRIAKMANELNSVVPDFKATHTEFCGLFEGSGAIVGRGAVAGGGRGWNLTYEEWSHLIEEQN